MIWNWEAYAWLAWLLAFCVLEAIGLFRHSDAMTLTFFVEHHSPVWARAAFLGWLFYHFIIASPAKG